MTQQIAVCVPVRDEAVRLPRLLQALAAQDGPPFTLCLLFDGCTDASAAVVAERVPALGFPIVTHSLPGGDANAGRARRAAMTLGETVVGTDGIIVSTDADSVPLPGWLTANLAALARADVVAGRIVRRSGTPIPIQDRVEAYYDALFALRRRLDPVPWEAPRTHHYASGASLAFRVGAYAAIGGFEAVPAGEDGRIVDAAHRAGLRVRRDASVVVETSARRRGRARGGLADHLYRLDREPAMPTMAHPDDCAWRYRANAIARVAFDNDLTPLARLLGRSLAEVTAIATEAANAEAFSTRVVPPIPGGERIVTLDVAEAALATLEQSHEREAA